MRDIEERLREPEGVFLSFDNRIRSLSSIHRMLSCIFLRKENIKYAVESKLPEKQKCKLGLLKSS